MSKSKGQFTKEIPLPKKLFKNLTSLVQKQKKHTNLKNDDQSRTMEGKLV